MKASPSEPTKLKLLSLPDDILGKIINNLAITTKYTLQSSQDAVNFASTNKRLHRIFSRQLTHVTPLIANRHADTLAQENIESLIKTARKNLRELCVPDCGHSYVQELPNLCPNLEALYAVERYHIFSEPPLDDTDDDEEEENEAGQSDADENASDGGEANEHQQNDDENGDNPSGENGASADNNSGNDANGNNDDDIIVSANSGAENNVSDGGDNASGAGNDAGSGDNNAIGSEDNVRVNNNNGGINIVSGGNDSVSGGNNGVSGNGNNVSGGNSNANNNNINDSDDSDADTCENDDSENDDSENDSDDADGNQENEGNNDLAKDDDNTKEEAVNECPLTQLIPRLNLRKLSVVRLPDKLIECIMTKLADNSLQELHLYKMRKFQLPLLIPLLSHRMKVLTVTMSGWIHDSFSEEASKFVDALIPAVAHIPVVTIHLPGACGLSTLNESRVNMDNLDFPQEAASVIASARENTCKSECTKIDLAGESTFRILSGVNPNASITLSLDRISVCDRGEGTYITSVPLYHEFLEQDVSHLERAYILQRSCIHVQEIDDYTWDPEWSRRLAGRRLELIRCFDVDILNSLNLSTEVLELFCAATPNVIDWTCLAGVRELYLLGPPWKFEDERFITIGPVVEALPGLIDAFRGEFICLGCFVELDCSNCPDREKVIENANKCKDAISRFVRRGGDAATVSHFVDSLLRELKTCEDSSDE